MEKQLLDGLKNPSKIAKIQNYYLKESYGALIQKEELEKKVIHLDLEIKYIKDGRGEYKIYIKPIKGLPEINISNIGVFSIFCMTHGFIPIVNDIRISDSGNKISIGEYKEFIFLQRLFHIFFTKGFDFTKFDIIGQILKNNDFKKIFEDNNINFLTSPEILSIISYLEEIKKVGIDLHKYHFHNKLRKFKNVEAMSLENVFLEIAIKYENFVREYIGFDKTYIKPASYEEDMKQKTDFIWMFSENNKKAKLNKIPIQFTLADFDDSKLNGVKTYFGKSNLNEMIYLQVFGKLKEQQFNIKNKYKNWINNPDYRQAKDLNKFPLFINEIEEYTEEAIIMYFYLHAIRKVGTFNKKFKIGNIDFSKTEYKKTRKKRNELEFKIYYKGDLIGIITSLTKK